MARPKKEKSVEEVGFVDDDKTALLQEIEDLKRQNAELTATQVDAKPDDAMQWLKDQNAVMMQALAGVIKNGNQVTDPGALKSRKGLPENYGKAYKLTDERKAQVSAIFARYEGKGIEYKYDDKSGAVTFRRKVKVRVYDKENEVWTREEAWKSESVHCSSSDSTINKLIRFLLLV